MSSQRPPNGDTHSAVFFLCKLSEEDKRLIKSLLEEPAPPDYFDKRLVYVERDQDHEGSQEDIERLIVTTRDPPPFSSSPRPPSWTRDLPVMESSL